MLTIQSSPSNIERAITQHNWYFAGYVLVLALTILATWLLWKSGNRVQGEIRADADARIAEAHAEAAKANERAQELEKQNLLLQRDIMLLRLQSVDPNRSQAEWDHHFTEYFLGVEDVLNGRPARPRDPNPARRNVGPRTERRRLADENKSKIINALANEPRGTIDIVCAIDPVLKGEPHQYATELAEAFRGAGWTVNDLGESVVISPLIPDLTLYVGAKDEYTQDSALYTAFWALGLWLRVTVEQSDSRRGLSPLLIVGLLG